MWSYRRVDKTVWVDFAGITGVFEPWVSIGHGWNPLSVLENDVHPKVMVHHFHISPMFWRLNHHSHQFPVKSQFLMLIAGQTNIDVKNKTFRKKMIHKCWDVPHQFTSMLVYRRVNHHVWVALPTCDTPSGIPPTEDPSLGHSHLASGSQGGLMVGGDRVNINGHGKNEYDTSLRNEIRSRYLMQTWSKHIISSYICYMLIYLILLYFMHSIYDISFISLNPHDLWVPPVWRTPISSPSLRFRNSASHPALRDAHGVDPGIMTGR